MVQTFAYEKSATDCREKALIDWVEAELGCCCTWSTISADAGWRRYYRVAVTLPEHAGKTSWIAVDAPPDSQRNDAFVDIARRAVGAGLNVPAVLAFDRMNGFLILSDLGDQCFLDVCESGAGERTDRLLNTAVDALIRWQSRISAEGLEILDRTTLHTELRIFTEWYVKRHLGLVLSNAAQSAIEAAYTTILDRIERQNHVLVHRDYISRNLMVTEPMPGIIDFQDARAGPVAYDIASLCRDAFISWPADQVLAWQQRYWVCAREAGLPVAHRWAEFAEDVAWIGLQRHLKVLGVFARLRWRDGKPGYITDAWRFIDYVRPMIESDPALAGLRPFLQCAR